MVTFPRRWAALISLVLSEVTTAQTIIRQDQIHDAARLWVTDPVTAEAQFGHISTWDVSSVTSMNGLFDALDLLDEARNFNDDISAWNVSSCRDFQHMFRFASSFNQNLSSWDTSSATRLDGMFMGAQSFTSDISGWSTGKVLLMSEMFSGASAFNIDLSAWNISNVLDFSFMFQDAVAFEQTLCWPDMRKQSDVDVPKMFCGSSGNFDPQCVPRSSSFIEDSRDGCPAPTPAPTVTAAPSPPPFGSPSLVPSASPSAAPSAAPSASPSAAPSAAPSLAPSAAPSPDPTASVAPSTEPSSSPSLQPTTVDDKFLNSAAPPSVSAAVPTWLLLGLTIFFLPI